MWFLSRSRFRVSISQFGMGFLYSDPGVYFGRFFRNELAGTVKLGNFDFPRFKISIFISDKTLSGASQSTSFPEDGPPAKDFSSHSYV